MNPTIKPSTKSSRIHASIARTAPLTVAQMLETIQQEEGTLARRLHNLESLRYFCEMVEEMTAVKVTSIQRLAMSDGYILTLSHGYTVTWLVSADNVRCRRSPSRGDREIAAGNLVAQLLHRHPKEK